MKRFLIISLAVVSLGILITGLTTPIFAHDPDDGGATPASDETWQAIHEACENGDWEAMTKAAEEAHGENFNDMPCHDEDTHDHASDWNSMDDHMTEGMMSGMH